MLTILTACSDILLTFQKLIVEIVAFEKVTDGKAGGCFDGNGAETVPASVLFGATDRYRGKVPATHDEIISTAVVSLVISVHDLF